MCGRYYIDDESLERAAAALSIGDSAVQKQLWNKDIHPTDSAPVILFHHNDLQLSIQKFGFKNAHGGLLVNARAETLLEKRMFRHAVQSRRIIIPAGNFYEWNSRKEMSRFSRTDHRPLYFAGIYDIYDNQPSFVIITTAANKSMEEIHDRMPLILEENQVRDWIIYDQAAMKMLGQVPVILERKTDYEQLSFC